MKTKLVTAVITVAGLAGCATPADLNDPARWTKPGVTRQQTVQDLAACRVMSSATSGEMHGHGLIRIAVERNRREELVRDGMLAKGYSPVAPGRRGASE